METRLKKEARTDRYIRGEQETREGGGGRVVTSTKVALMTYMWESPPAV
jgi:hypothetical protein